MTTEATALAHQLVCRAIEIQARPDLAVRLVHQALELNPDEPLAHAMLAWDHRRSGRLGDAERSAMTAIELAPSEPHGHLELSMVRAAQRDARGAVTALDAAAALGAGGAAFLGVQARVQMLVGMRDEAEASARAALALDPREPDAREVMATISLARGRFADVERITASLLEDDPGAVHALDLRAQARLLRGDVGGAVALAREALALRPDLTHLQTISRADRGAARLLVPLRWRLQGWLIGDSRPARLVRGWILRPISVLRRRFREAYGIDVVALLLGVVFLLGLLVAVTLPTQLLASRLEPRLMMGALGISIGIGGVTHATLRRTGVRSRWALPAGLAATWTSLLVAAPLTTSLAASWGPNVVGPASTVGLVAGIAGLVIGQSGGGRTSMPPG